MERPPLEENLPLPVIPKTSSFGKSPNPDESPIMCRILLLTLFFVMGPFVTLAACSFDSPPDGGQYRCASNLDCSQTYSCINQKCILWKVPEKSTCDASNCSASDTITDQPHPYTRPVRITDAQILKSTVLAIPCGCPIWNKSRIPRIICLYQDIQTEALFKKLNTCLTFLLTIKQTFA